MDNQRIQFGALDACDYFDQGEREEMRRRLINVTDGSVDPIDIMSELSFTREHRCAPYRCVIYATAREIIARYAETASVDDALRTALIRMYESTAHQLDRQNPGSVAHFYHGSIREIAYRNEGDRLSKLSAACRRIARRIRAARTDAELLEILRQVRPNRLSIAP